MEWSGMERRRRGVRGEIRGGVERNEMEGNENG